MRRTKIVATIGPKTNSVEMIKRLIKAGMNVARINMSHGSREEYSETIGYIKAAREELNVPVAIMLDTKGPEIRIKNFKSGKAVLNDGDRFILTTNEVEGDNERVSISYAPLPSKLKAKDKILINDGLIELFVEETTSTDIICIVVEGGELTNRKSINIPNKSINMPYLSQTDKEDIIFGIGEDVDYFALSFVRCAEDVKLVKKIISDNNADDIQLIAKIENREGVDNILSILDECDGAMVARGDMGVEIPFEELPGIQKSLISKCYRQGKKVITATQMLESMIQSPRPTRAEISDVANAVYDGSSAIMLSGETAVGRFPVQAVKTMAKIAEKAESSIDYRQRFMTSNNIIQTITDAVSHSTVAAAYDLNAKAIIAVSRSGYTVRKVSRFRPECIIIGETTSTKAYNQLAMNWGVFPVMSKMQTNSDKLFEHSLRCAKNTEFVKTGDIVIMTAGVPVGKSGSTNTMRIESID